MILSITAFYKKSLSSSKSSSWNDFCRIMWH